MSTKPNKPKPGGYAYRNELNAAERDVTEAMHAMESVTEPSLPPKVLSALLKVSFLLFRALLHVRTARDISCNGEVDQ